MLCHGGWCCCHLVANIYIGYVIAMVAGVIATFFVADVTTTVADVIATRYICVG